jgi:hypothetical protein
MINSLLQTISIDRFIDKQKISADDVKTPHIVLQTLTLADGRCLLALDRMPRLRSLLGDFSHWRDRRLRALGLASDGRVPAETAAALTAFTCCDPRTALRIAPRIVAEAQRRAELLLSPARGTTA